MKNKKIVIRSISFFSTLLCLYLIVGDRNQHLIFGRYKILHDSQVIKCIPGINWYLADYGDRTPKRDALFSFKSQNLGIYPDGTDLVKYMRGIPGDHITVKDGTVSINDQPISYVMPLAERSDISLTKFNRDYILDPKNFFMMGTHQESYDSRYWGAIDESQINGRAYPLF